MKKRRIVTIVGARPQFIKAAVVSRALRSQDRLSETMIHTGQHYDSGMSARFFSELQIPRPEYFLGIGSGGHGYQTGEMLKQLESVLIAERPAAVIVYGDTNSTLAGAVAAAKLHIPVAHVEAGLRSFNRRMPEEINRVVTDHVSSLLFCPTATARENLASEGIRKGVYRTGDVMYDAALQFAPVAERSSAILTHLGLARGRYLLATIHRAENTDDQERLSHILTALNRLSRDMEVVLPLHPRTRKMVRQYEMESLLEPVKVIDPLGFLDMLMLIKNAAVIGTDSGGVQKEAYFHRVGCVTLRDETEWVETVEAGWNILAGADSAAAIVETVRKVLAPGARRKEIPDYGDGRAGRRIAGAIERYLDETASSWRGDRREIAS